jgi:hypothetical protein
MSKHTAGPWFVENEYNVFAVDTHRLVASAGGYASNVRSVQVHVENVANARLIAAAPDLLSVLREIRQRIQLNIDEGETEWTIYTPMIDAAIAKAEGT